MQNIDTDTIPTTTTCVNSGRIHKLSNEVINKIAAGEVIQRPSNALKELIENSLDAGSTSITITVKDGGLKLLQIQDNGHGIKLEDLDIVCERFTTSKLNKFEDLRKINTFGFRGEALSSISHISHLSILTKTPGSQCAYKAFYNMGKLAPATSLETSSSPKPCAGLQGTQIKVEDLFYSIPSRKKIFKSPQDEHHRIHSLIQKYSINNPKIQFILKKSGEATPDVHTPGQQTEAQVIGLLYGNDVSKELKEITLSDDKLEFQMKGYCSSTNYNCKKTVFILFINNRLVDSRNLKSSLEQIYSKYLPKGTHPFIFIRLLIVPKNVDVNIHPTKSEVKFLYEDQIIEQIQKQLDSQLSISSTSKVFSTQSIITDFDNINNNINTSSNNNNNNNISSSQKVIDNTYDKDKVRMDPKTQTLNAFLNPLKDTVSNKDDSFEYNNNNIDMDVDNPALNNNNKNNNSNGSGDIKQEKNLNSKDQSFVSQRKPKKYKASELTSVKNLINMFESDHHSGLKEFFNECIFIGCLDHCYSLAQFKTKLYLINLENLSKELFYQLTLKGFSDFDSIKFTNPLSVYDLILVSMESPISGWLPNDGPKEKISEYLTKLVLGKSELLFEYFSIEINQDGKLCSLPQILENYVPCMDNLPLFLLRLATEVDWEYESECLQGIARELALFYKLEPTILDKTIEINLPSHLLGKNNNNNNNNINFIKRDGKEWVIQHLIFPGFRNFYPSKKLSNDGSVIQITSLDLLYKVFERC